MSAAILTSHFFARDCARVASALLGKVIRRKYRQQWLSARIIETEAYYCTDKASHSSLGYTEKRKAMFMPPGTIYMYYARGADSLNISVGDAGDAVLIKAAYPYFDRLSPEKTLHAMQKLNPAANGSVRPVHKLCAGQTLLCKSLQLKVPDWDQQQFDRECFFIEDVSIQPSAIIQTARLGIAAGRDEHLPLRFVDYDYAAYCTANPLTRRHWIKGRDYHILDASG